MSTTAYLWGRKETILINTSPLKVNDIVCMHAIGMEAAREFDYSTGRVAMINGNNIIITLITGPKKPYQIVGNHVNFIISTAGWGYEVLPGEWDF